MRWHYQVEVVAGNDAADLSRRLEELGRDGWELVTIVSGATLANMLIVLKRQSEKTQ